MVRHGSCGRCHLLIEDEEVRADVQRPSGLRLTVIVDTKFYKHPLGRRWDGRRVHSGNLCQIFSHVTNWMEAVGEGEPEAEGWLLYAAVEDGFDYRFELMGRRIRVCSIDLGQGWRGIERELKGLMADGRASLELSCT